MFIFYGSLPDKHVQVLQRHLGKWIKEDEREACVLNLPEGVRLEVLSINQDGEEIPEVVVRHEVKVGIRKPKWV